MNQPELATCQCIIAHPSKPKFLAVKHTGGHLPPTVKIPLEFDVGGNIAYVLDGVRRKYGLNTVVLRQLARFSDYQCIELEILGQDTRRLSAVWVGLEDYARIRGVDSGGYDPLADWLREKERGVIPATRPPWERPGWFKEALHWINFQLDRGNLQATGSVVQHRGLRHSATVLRVPTSTGNLYFKAALDKAPQEVALTRYLAGKWPDNVATVLGYDAGRNWMLIQGYTSADPIDAGIGALARAAATMASVQAESIAVTARLTELGCQTLGLDQLKHFLGQAELLDLFPLPEAGGLSDAERAELLALAPGLGEICDRLGSFQLPETLINPNFRVANFFPGPESVRFIDWARTSIGHPFFSLLGLLTEDHRPGPGAIERDPVVQAYLQRFEGFEPRARLLEALGLATQLQHAWELLLWSRELACMEPRSVSMTAFQQFLTLLARRLLAAQRGAAA